MIWIATAAAAEIQVGGAVDAMGGMLLVDEELAGVAALRQLEGDLQLGGPALNLRLDLDLQLSWTGSVGLAGIGPEWLAVRGEGSDFRAAAGFFPAPWHGESRDPWMEPLVTLSPTDLVLPRAMVGAAAGFGAEKAGFEVILGLEGAPLDLVAPEAIVLSGADGLVGARAWFDSDKFSLGGGVFSMPWREPIGAQLDVRGDIGVVRLFGEALYASGALGGQARVELWPEGRLSPVARGEYVQGYGPGFAAGISSLWEELFRAKLELSWRTGVPGAYAEVAVFSPSRRVRASLSGDERASRSAPAEE